MYNPKIILRSLFLAPIPLLSFFALFVVITNQEFSLLSMTTIIFLYGLFYLLFYCPLNIPIAYIISILLNKYQKLNLFTIFIGTVLMWLILSLPMQYIFGGGIQGTWWQAFHWPFYAMILFTGLCYWLLLRYFQKKNV